MAPRRDGESGPRRRGKPEPRKRGGRPSFERRSPPPEATGRESDYLSRRKGERKPVTIQLADGKTVRGVIEYYDREMIKLTCDEGANVFVPKADIRFILDG